MKPGKRNVERGVTRVEREPTPHRAARFRYSSFANRHVGLTLIELLIVMTILVLLVGAAIPVMSPANDGRRLREAARGLNTYLAGAQARAVKSGRPFGVMLKKLSQDTGDEEDNAVCLELFYVEQPAPFAGFEQTSRVMIGTGETSTGGADLSNPNRFRIRFVRLSNGAESGSMGLPSGVAPDLPPPGLFRRGDQIEVGGRLYEFSDTTMDIDDQGYYLSTAGTPDGTLFATPVGNTKPAVPYNFDSNGNRLSAQKVTSPVNPYWTEPLPYKIHRQPVKTSAPPYQLPEGAAIDLRASGTDQIVFYNKDDGLDGPISNPNPVTIMFAPEGAVSSLITGVDDPVVDDNDRENYVNDDILQSFRVTSAIFLLIGNRENIPAPDPTVEADVDFTTTGRTDAELQEAKAKINWLGGESRWVTIGGRTGAVITSPLAFVDAGEIARNNADFPTLSAVRNQEIFRSREFAASKSTIGGR